jgi:hypothetical protein
MKFIGKDGQEVELKILGYQFDTDFDNEWDANWLRIYLNVKSNVGHWQTVDPSLLTEEVKRLTQWFADLSNEKEVDTEVDFIEPNLSFQLLDSSKDNKTIQIKFDVESKPQSADDVKDYQIAFAFTNDELSEIANGLLVELDRFPFRQFPHTKKASP